MDFKVGSSTCVWGSHFSCSMHASLGWHGHVPHPKAMRNHFIGQVKTTMGECVRWCTPKWPQTRIKHAYATTWNVTPRPDTCCTSNLEIHFPISSIDARKKLKTWACVGIQGASMCWTRTLLNVNIWQRIIRCPAIFLWFLLSRGVCVTVCSW